MTVAYDNDEFASLTSAAQKAGMSIEEFQMFGVHALDLFLKTRLRRQLYSKKKYLPLLLLALMFLVLNGQLKAKWRLRELGKIRFQLFRGSENGCHFDGLFNQPGMIDLEFWGSSFSFKKGTVFFLLQPFLI